MHVHVALLPFLASQSWAATASCSCGSCLYLLAMQCSMCVTVLETIISASHTKLSAYWDMLLSIEAADCGHVACTLDLPAADFELLQLHTTHLNTNAGDMTIISAMQHSACHLGNEHQRPCFLSKWQACQFSLVPATSCYPRPHNRTAHHLPSSRCASVVHHSAAAAATFLNTRPHTTCAMVPSDIHSDRNPLQGDAVFGVTYKRAESSFGCNAVRMPMLHSLCSSSLQTVKLTHHNLALDIEKALQ